MSSVGTARSEHSHLGIASFVLSFLPVALLVGAFALVLYLTRNDPPGTDQTGYGLGMLMLVLLTTLSEIVALGLGIAGALQRHRKRTFALVGVQRPRSGGDPRLCRTRTLGLWHPGANHQPTRGPPQRIVARERIVLLPAALGRRTSENTPSETVWKFSQRCS
jgi:hypothetical protein